MNNPAVGSTGSALNSVDTELEIVGSVAAVVTASVAYVVAISVGASVAGAVVSVATTASYTVLSGM